MMKKLFVVLLILVLGVGNAATVNSLPSDVPQGYLAFSTIDGIEVPEEVLMNVQTEHQGYAVTHANKVARNPQAYYQLQVSKDTTANPFESIYLLYSENWDPSGREQAPVPAQLQVENQDEDDERKDASNEGRGRSDKRRKNKDD